MKITEISYGRTKNLGNYQSERLDVTAEVGDEENPTTTYQQLKAWVAQQLYPESTASQSYDAKPYWFHSTNDMRIKIQINAEELTDILAQHLDETALQYTVYPANIDRISAACDPDGELNSLDVYLDFDDEQSSDESSSET